MRVKILGKWMELGMQHTYSIKKEIKTPADFAGMKLRYAGGTANAQRINTLGGTALLVPWPDVPLAMSQGVMDGLVTTYENSLSSKLMDSGMRFAYEDSNQFNQYVPMMRANFFNKQPKEVQQAILESWDIAATQQRKDAADVQQKAKEALVKNGLKVVFLQRHCEIDQTLVDTGFCRRSSGVHGDLGDFFIAWHHDPAGSSRQVRFFYQYVPTKTQAWCRSPCRCAWFDLFSVRCVLRQCRGLSSLGIRRCFNNRAESPLVDLLRCFAWWRFSNRLGIYRPPLS